jgi:hypothetical protein
MKMEQGNPLNNLSKQGQKSNLEKQLDFQEATRPSISEEYYTSVIDFMARMYIMESYAGKNDTAFPEEFRKYVGDGSVPYNTLLGNGSMKVAVMKIQEDRGDDVASKKGYEILKQLIQDVKNELGFAATFEYNKDRHQRILDAYIACFPGKVVKNEKGQWVAEETEGGAAKFFSLLVARGLIDEKVISESGMATLGTKGIKFGEDLKKKGLEKIIEEPLHKS